MLWVFTVVQIICACLVGLLCVILGLAGKKPRDATVLGLVLVEVFLVAQLVISLIAPATGNTPTGNLIEFWAYLLTALIIPPLAVVWALLERTRWSNVVLGVAAFTIAIMVWRMHQIWNIQIA